MDALCAEEGSKRVEIEKGIRRHMFEREYEVVSERGEGDHVRDHGGVYDMVVAL